MIFNNQSILLLLYTFCIFLFGCFIRYLEYSDFFLCYNCQEVDSPETLFDYIIVGCGSAGSIVARRLAENKKVKVLLLEAGNHGNSLLDIPSFGLLLQKTPFDWQYTSVPQKQSCLSLHNNASIWPMGKMVGGTGMLNNMIYVRGHPEDFNNWFKQKEGYSFKEYVLPYFKKVEKWKHESTYGSVYINNLPFSTKLSSYVLKAARELNFDITQHTENCEEGFGLPKVNSMKGQRSTPAHILLKKDTPNIILRTKSIVEKILFHNNFEAYGVKYRYLGDTYIARASKGIILSAGVVGSTKILLHSGIGPKDHLEKIGIRTKLNLPVGENLQDHITTGFDLILLNETLGIGIQEILSPFSALRYFWNGSGPWTTVGCEVLAHLNTNHKKNVAPNLQIMGMNLGLNGDRGVHFRKLVGITDKIWNEYFGKLNDSVTITLLPVNLHPQSRGTIRLQNKQFTSEVLINPNYLTHPFDIDVLVKGIELIRKLVDTKAMKSLGATFNTNVFPPCKKHTFGSTLYWRCYIRHLTISTYHPAGTCKMGHDRDKTSVVNFDFKVKGTNNLFVVDGSVIPTLTSGNINAAIFMLAEMASDIVKYREFLNKGKCWFKEIFIKNKFCIV